MNNSISKLLALVLASLLLVASFNFTIKASASGEVTITTQDMVDGIANNIVNENVGEMISTDSIKYLMQYGLYKEDEINFTNYRPSPYAIESAETYGLSNYTSCFVNGNLVRISEKYSLIYKIEATKDLVLTINNNDSKADATINRVTVTTYLNDGNFDVILNNIVLPAEGVISTIPKDSILQEVHMKKGDILHLTLTTVGDGRSFTNFTPYFIVDTASYSDDNRYDFDRLSKFKADIEVAKDTVTNTYKELDKDLYSLESQLLLYDIKDKAITNLDLLTFDQDIDAFIETVNEEFATILTKSQLKDLLAETLAKYKKQLDEFMKDYKKIDYTSENWKAIQNSYDYAIAEMQDAVTVNKIKSVYAQAIKNIEEPQTTNFNKILIAVIASVVVIMLMAIAIIVIKKIKK